MVVWRGVQSGCGVFFQTSITHSDLGDGVIIQMLGDGVL